jgi:hypothetical protein
MKRVLAMIFFAAVLGLASSVAAQTLSTVKSRGILHCGSNTGLVGFGLPDAQGNWSGFDVDFCRAVAAAIFDDPKKVKFVLHHPVMKDLGAEGLPDRLPYPCEQTPQKPFWYMNASGFAYSHLFAKGLPPAAPRWNGFTTYNFIGGHNDPRQIPAAALAEFAVAALKHVGSNLPLAGVGPLDCIQFVLVLISL